MEQRSKEDLISQLLKSEESALQKGDGKLQKFYQELQCAAEKITWDEFYDDQQEFDHLRLHFIQYMDTSNKYLETLFFPQLFEFFCTGYFYVHRPNEFHFGTKALEELHSIYGLGKTKIRELLSRYHIDSIPKLKRRVAMMPSILNDAQVIALKHHEDMKKMIPREEIELLEPILNTAASEIGTLVHITGSYRRGAAECKNIDILIEEKEPADKTGSNRMIHRFYGLLHSAGVICDILSLNDARIVALARLAPEHPARRWNILSYAKAQLPFKLLYSTGDISFNKELGRIARLKNMLLTSDNIFNQHTLSGMKCETIDIKSILKKDYCESEEDIFVLLGLSPSDLPPPVSRTRSAGIILRKKIELQLGLTIVNLFTQTTPPVS
jgi:DNA polymerase/3'-5' exonuclease PolX